MPSLSSRAVSRSLLPAHPDGRRSLLRGRRDDIFSWNARKPGLRQHHLEHLDLFYFPQTTTPLMGPTAIVPYSNYWTVRRRRYFLDLIKSSR